MTPTEKWIFELALVYSIPSFLGGIGITLLFVHWRGLRVAVTILSRFLSPQLTFGRHDNLAPGTAPKDAQGLLRGDTRLCEAADKCDLSLQ